MSHIPELPDRLVYDMLLDRMATRVIDEVGTELDPDAEEWHATLIEDEETLDFGTPVLFLSNAEKYDIIETFVHMDEFEIGLQGFVEYGDDDDLIEGDWQNITEAATMHGGPGAYRKHAERLAYVELLDTLRNHPHVVE